MVFIRYAQARNENSGIYTVLRWLNKRNPIEFPFRRLLQPLDYSDRQRFRFDLPTVQATCYLLC